MQSQPYPVQERNKLLLSFFERLGYNCKLVGNPNQPKIVIDDEFAISGYVHNKLYHFTTKPFGGVAVYTVNLTWCDDVTRDKIDELIAATEKRQLWTICHDSLHYVKTEQDIPYFSPVAKRFFFDEAKAIETFDWLSNKFVLDSLRIDSPELDC